MLPDRLSETVGDFAKALWGKVHPHTQWFAAMIPSRVPAMAMFVERPVLNFILCNHVEMYLELLLSS